MSEQKYASNLKKKKILIQENKHEISLCKSDFPQNNLTKV